ncbi:ScbR family autoregulator-binding transcription factor [Streptomyces sp. NPDC059697]|uniref:ScbR family autoregulator-binding transcription factor n=1 Tax=Streptomyces sp. NPDC059697 TaxID=3346912 RepID=UPI00368CB566
MARETESRPVRTRRAATNAKGEPLKQDRAARTRESVLEAAAEAFAAKGFPEVTVLDVAERAGLTKGAVYFHFANKDALAVAVAQEFYGRVGEVTEALRRENRTPLDRAIEFVRRNAVLFRDDPVIQAGARLQIERRYIDSSLPTPYVGALEALTEFLTGAEEEDQLSPGADPEVLARVLLSAFFGAQHMSWVLNDRKDLVERAEETLQCLFPGHRS